MNAASQKSGRLAPNAIFTVYGKNLSFSTWALSAAEIRNGNLPVDVPGLNVTVLVRGVAVPLYYVSPTQINALLPASQGSGVARLEIVRGSARGPRVEFTIVSDAPELFALEDGSAAATHPDGRAVTAAAPVAPGAYVVLYGTGWGSVATSQQQQHIASSGALLTRWPDLEVHLGERRLERADVFYAGLTPGFAGLYQINFRVPETVSETAPVWLRFGEMESGTRVRLPIAAPPSNATETPP